MEVKHTETTFELTPRRNRIRAQIKIVLQTEYFKVFLWTLADFSLFSVFAFVLYLNIFRGMFCSC